MAIILSGTGTAMPSALVDQPRLPDEARPMVAGWQSDDGAPPSQSTVVPGRWRMASLPPPRQIARVVASLPHRAFNSAISDVNSYLLEMVLPRGRKPLAAMAPWPSAPPGAMPGPMVIAYPAAHVSTADRWSLSAWAVFRPDGNSGGSVVQPLLGGSQAGARLSMAIDPAHRVNAYARLVSAGRLGDGVEGAAGIAVQPFAGVPVTLAVERRQRLSGRAGRSDFALLVSGGVYDRALAGRWRIDGYGAGGVVGVRDQAAFAEGQVMVRRAITRHGRVAVDIGLGAWGAAQPGAARLDVGPALRFDPGGDAPSATIDWRYRIGGNAAPASGPALSVGWDF